MILSRIAAAGMAKIKLFLHLLERFLSVHEEQHEQAGEGGTESGAGGAFNLTRSWHPQLSTGVMLLAELSARVQCAHVALPAQVWQLKNQRVLSPSPVPFVNISNGSHRNTPNGCA